MWNGLKQLIFSNRLRILLMKTNHWHKMQNQSRQQQSGEVDWILWLCLLGVFHSNETRRKLTNWADLDVKRSRHNYKPHKYWHRYYWEGTFEPLLLSHAWSFAEMNTVRKITNVIWFCSQISIWISRLFSCHKNKISAINQIKKRAKFNIFMQFF